MGSFESIEKRQTRAFFERFERNLDRVEEDTTRTKKNRHHHSVPKMPHNKSEALFRIEERTYEEEEEEEDDE